MQNQPGGTVPERNSGFNGIEGKTSVANVITARLPVKLEYMKHSSPMNTIKCYKNLDTPKKLRKKNTDEGWVAKSCLSHASNRTALAKNQKCLLTLTRQPDIIKTLN